MCENNLGLLYFFFFVGHVLHSMVREHRSQFLDRVAQFCSGNWRERVFQVSFICRICFSGTLFIVHIEGEVSCSFLLCCFAFLSHLL
jgi:hypothetical protein